MKIQVTFDVDGFINEWKFGQYLAEILEIPQGDPSIYNITGIDDVKILPDPWYKCLDCEDATFDTEAQMDAHIDTFHREGYGG